MPKPADKELTQKEKEILEFINEQVEENGMSPSLREIGQRFRISSTSHVAYYLKKLDKKGFIKRDRRARGIIVSARKAVFSDITRVPILGRVSAGTPIPAIEDIEGYINVDRDIVKGMSVFALRVKGESMIGAGILDGDIVIVKHQPAADSGALVVADIDGEATVKKLKIIKNKVVLEPANPDYKPIISNNISIIGKVVGLVRNYGVSRIS